MNFLFHISLHAESEPSYCRK